MTCSENQEVTVPALVLINTLRLRNYHGYDDIASFLHAIRRDTIMDLLDTCSGYSAETLEIVALGALHGLRCGDRLNPESFMEYMVSAAPILRPFLTHQKHRFHESTHRDRQIGEWSLVAYDQYRDIFPYPSKELARGHALLVYITGSSAPRNRAFSDRELMVWIGENADALVEHYDTLEEHKVYDREFLQGLLKSSSVPLVNGML